MKKIGIVGGAAWQSTAEYYRMLCTWSAAHHQGAGMKGLMPTPPMAIESLVMRETRALRAAPGSGEAGWAAYDDVIRQALLRLERAGCDFAIIANNTMHTRLHAITKGVQIDVLSILSASATAARTTCKQNALVLGTSVTMRSDDYARALKAEGLAPNKRLDEAVIDRMQALIDAEFYADPIGAGAREGLMAICRAEAPDPANTVILLACTELPLAFPDHLEDPVFVSGGYTFVNTTAAHVQAALDRSLAD